MTKLNKFFYFNVTFLLLTFANFYFSNLIVTKLSEGWDFSNSILRIVYAENTGAAFSLLQNSTAFLIVLSFIAIFVIFLYIIKYLETIKMFELFVLTFLLSGIVGNLSERIFLGYVRDFFDLAFINFPIFNISDIFINISVLSIIIMILFNRKPAKK